MLNARTHPRRVMMLCAYNMNSARQQVITRLMARIADRLENEIGVASISPVLCDFRSRTVLVAEFPNQPGNAFEAAASDVLSLSELNALRAAGAVDCEFLLPLLGAEIDPNACWQFPQTPWPTKGTKAL